MSTLESSHHENLKLKCMLISSGIHPGLNNLKKLSKLTKFMKSPNKNGHVQFNKLRAYLRKSYRYVDGEYYLFLEIGSVGVDPENQKQGIFSKWLKRVESEMKLIGLNIVVECVWNSHLSTYLLKQNYIKEVGSFPGNYYKIFTPSSESCETEEELMGYTKKYFEMKNKSCRN